MNLQHVLPHFGLALLLTVAIPRAEVNRRYFDGGPPAGDR